MSIQHSAVNLSYHCANCRALTDHTWLEDGTVICISCGLESPDVPDDDQDDIGQLMLQFEHDRDAGTGQDDE